MFLKTEYGPMIKLKSGHKDAEFSLHNNTVLLLSEFHIYKLEITAANLAVVL